MVALPILIVTSYVLYQRRECPQSSSYLDFLVVRSGLCEGFVKLTRSVVLGQEPKKLPPRTGEGG